jgi:hypothetical protein
MFTRNQEIISKPSSFWTYLGLIPIAPVKGFTKLMQDSRRLHLGLEAVLFVALGYTVALILIASSPGRISQMDAWVSDSARALFLLGSVLYRRGHVWLLDSRFGC